MKKALLICLVIFTVFLTACVVQETPEYVAETYLNALANVDYNTMGSVSIISFEELYQPIISSAMAQGDMTEAEAFEKLSGFLGLENEVDNMADFLSEYSKYGRKNFEESYGEGYSIEVSIINISDLSDEDKSDMLSEASDYYDSMGVVISDIVGFSEIDECKKAEAKIYYNDSNGKTLEKQDVAIYLARVNNTWKVLNIGAQY